MECCLRADAVVMVEAAQQERKLLGSATIAPSHAEMQIEMSKLGGVEIGPALL